MKHTKRGLVAALILTALTGCAASWGNSYNVAMATLGLGSGAAATPAARPCRCCWAEPWLGGPFSIDARRHRLRFRARA